MDALADLYHALFLYAADLRPVKVWHTGLLWSLCITAFFLYVDIDLVKIDSFFLVTLGTIGDSLIQVFLVSDDFCTCLDFDEIIVFGLA